MAMNRIPLIKIGETEVQGTNITKEDYGKKSVDDQLLFDAASEIENSPFLKDELEVAKTTINELLENSKVATGLETKDVEEADKQELMAAMDSFKLGDEFREKSTKSIENAKEQAWNKDIYNNEAAFVNYYSNEILGDNDFIELDKFGKKLVENGLIEEDILTGFLKLIDDDGSHNLSRYELQTLLRASYEAYSTFDNKTEQAQNSNFEFNANQDKFKEDTAVY